MIGVVRFFVRHPVPANLLTISLIVGGIIASIQIRREFFPDIEPDTAQVLLSFPGASPEEIEESLARRIEDTIAEVDDVDRVETTVYDGGGAILVKFADGADVRRRADDVRDRIEAITDLPAEADRTRVIEFEPVIPVIQVTVHGDVGERSLKSAIREVEADLRSYSGMGRLLVAGQREDELRIEVNHEDLIRHGIAITRVAEAVSAWMREIPGGSIRHRDGDTKVRTMGVDERADSIRQIVVKSHADGGVVRLGDIAEVEEGFVDDLVVRRFNGEPSANCTIFRTGKQDAVDMAQFARGYVAARSGEALGPSWRERIFGSPRVEGWTLGASRGPLGMAIQAHSDLAKLIEDRLELLTTNALQGGTLVFLFLLLGVHWRAAINVTLGIVIAICGTILVMYLTGMSLNLLTMFALLMTLGMLADDAIVFAESIETEAIVNPDVESVVLTGVQRVMWPVVASVTTTIVAFIPLLMVGGQVGDILGELPMVVSIALLVSLGEAIFLLPGHMAHGLKKERRGERGFIDRFARPFDRFRERVLWPVIEKFHGRVALWCIDHRYMTVSAGLAAFILSLALIAGGRLPFTFLPSDDSETVVVELRMPLGSSLEATQAAGAKIEAAARALPEVLAITSVYGMRVDIESAMADSASTNLAQIFVELQSVELRERRSSEVTDALLRAAGPMDEAESITVEEISGGPQGADITYQVAGGDIAEVRLVAEEVKGMVAGVSGVLTVSDDDFDAQPELQIVLKPGAAVLGFTPIEVARQVRGALHGLDAHVFSQDREDVDVRVRLDDRTRASGDLADRLWVIPPSGIAVPLREIADVAEHSGPSRINRRDRERTVTVTADTDVATRPEAVVGQLDAAIVSLGESHPGVTILEGGRQRDLNEALAALPMAALAALAMIYALLAWLFGNYTQPLAVMISIPFGIIGMVLGHLAMGTDLTFLSLIGLVALAGVVVNNALVLVEFVNIEVAKGAPLREALAIAGEKRIRAILLTSVTTILGLSPIVLEQSFQARFLAPMAITIAGGLLSATVLTLLLLPSAVHIIDDAHRLFARLIGAPTNDARQQTP